MFINYVEAGYSVIPEYETGVAKIPYKEYFDNLPAQDEAANWDTIYTAQRGIGLILGKISGIMAVDIDTDNVNVLDAVEKILPESPVKRFGSKGYVAFYKYNESLDNKVVFKIKKKVVLEILSSRHKVTIPPSLHRKTKKPYVWLTKDLLTVGRDALPDLTPLHLEKLRNLGIFDKEPEFVAPKLSLSLPKDVSVDDVRDALNYIDPDCSYDDWIRVGYALESEFGSAGFELFDSWSSRGKKYKDNKGSKIYTVYRGFDSRSITISTLFHFAKLGGYSIKKSTDLYFEDVERWRKTKLVAAEQEPTPPAPEVKRRDLDENTLLASMPSTAGMLARWLHDQAIYKRPAFHIAGALSYISLLMSQKIKTGKGTFTNLYFLILGGTGTGKDHERKMFQKLHEELGIKNLHGLLMSRGGSGEGITSRLRTEGGKLLMVWDEFAQFIHRCNSTNPGANIVSQKEMLLTLFSSAGVTYEENATKSENVDDRGVAKSKKLIYCPCLSVYATSTKSELVKSMTLADISSGLLNRFLIVESKFESYVTKDNYWKDLISSEASVNREKKTVVPDNLKRSLVQLYNFTDPTHYNFKLGEAQAVYINFSGEDAGDAFQECAQSFEKERDKYAKAEMQEQADMMGRCLEQFIKVCLVLSDGVSMNPTQIYWARDFVLYCRNSALGIAQEEFMIGKIEKEKEKFVNIIKKAGKISRQELVVKTKFCRDLQHRISLLEEMEVAGQITIERDGKKQVSFISWNGGK